VKQASRNPEFGVGHLEKWAEMLQILKDISANRMPSVADLLKQASQAPQLAAKSPGDQTKIAGQVRASAQGSPAEGSEDEKQQPVGVPAIVDVESSQSLTATKTQPSETVDSKGSPSLGLPTTTLLGGGAADNSCPAGQKVEEAVIKQQDLLAEFEKISDELNRVLANLEGSTLVKRLKAASRVQYQVAHRLGDQLGSAIGYTPLTTESPSNLQLELAAQEAKSSHDVSAIMDDMQSYFERRQFIRFKSVLDEMRTEDVIGGLRRLGDDLYKESGLSLAQCEFWSDTLDRWAEDLVDPASGGT
jgi:hypothetical protein